jgi:CRISPR-associated protein (TIGR02710 family)
LNDELAKKVEQWMGMSTEQGKADSDKYYWEEIFPLNLKLFKSKQEMIPGVDAIDVLFLTVGTSPEPLILSISAIKPKRVVFLYSEQTLKFINIIVGKTGLEASEFDKYQVSQTNPIDIYENVISEWETFEGKGIFAADITGGTKSMTGGLAMVGGLLGLPILYVDGEYIPAKRRPKPGTEKLILLPNPYQIFGVLKEREAAELFRRMNYQAACIIYRELANTVPQPQKFEVLSALTGAYQAWDALDIAPAGQQLETAAGLIRQYRLEGLNNLFDNLTEQAKRLSHLKDKMPVRPGDSTLDLLQDKEALETLLFSIYHSSKRRAEANMFDSASLLLYRLLEVMAQRRLATHSIDTAEPDYNILQQVKPEDCLAKMNDIRKNLKHSSLAELPSPISLMDGYMLLQALNDPYNLSKSANNGKEIHFSRLINDVKKRNYSILAHGFIFVSEVQYREFDLMVCQLLELFCKVEQINFKKSFSLFEFAVPDHLFCAQ